MIYTKEVLNNKTDLELKVIYHNHKNDKTKLFKLKSGNFAIYKNGVNLYENKSERSAKIEFILLTQKDRGYDFGDELNKAFGSDIFGGRFFK